MDPMLASIVLLAPVAGWFAWRQNHHGVVGGPISLAKTIWLHYTMTMFFIVPFFFWRDRDLHAHVRLAFGLVFTAFLIRAVVQFGLAFIYRLWRCEYGIAHDLLVVAVIAALAWGHAGSPLDWAASWLAILVQASLLVEAFMAWQFRKLADPRSGIYFAAPTGHFQFVNRATWAAVGVGYPLLGWTLWWINHERHTIA
jgi:hypothetical protein